MLPKNEYNKLILEIKNLVEDLEAEFVVLCKDDVLKAMGFPEDWYSKLCALR